MRKRLFGAFLIDFAPHIAIACLGVIASRFFPDKQSQTVGAFITLSIVILLFLYTSIARQYSASRWLILLNSKELWTSIHDLVHCARDAALRRLPKVPDLTDFFAIMAEDQVEIERLLIRIRDVFVRVVPRKTKLMVTARQLRSDGKFHTFARVGEFNQNRRLNTQALGREDATIRSLDKKLRDKLVCVIITGSTRGDEEWTKQPNDQFGADRCVLMGAVLVKSPQGEDFTPGEIKWIVSVCADLETAFTNEHIPLMQACLDNVSLYANILARRSTISNKPFDGQVPGTINVNTSNSAASQPAGTQELGRDDLEGAVRTESRR